MYDPLDKRRSPSSLGSRRGSPLSSQNTQMAAALAKQSRKALSMLPFKMANRRFAFAFVTAAIIAAKVIHILAHQRAFSRRNLLFWTLSFLGQDYVLIISLRYLIEWAHNLPRKRALLRLASKATIFAVILFASTVSIVNITFYACSRSEMRWRNVDFAKDKSSRGVLLSGLASFIGIFISLIGLSWILQDLLYTYAGIAIDVVNWPLRCLASYRRHSATPDFDPDFNFESPKLPVPGPARNVAPIDTESRRQDFITALTSVGVRTRSRAATVYKICRGIWTVVFVIEVISVIMRPMEGSYIYMSWTTPLIPFIDFQDSMSNLQQLKPVYGSSINNAWDEITAISDPIPLEWLPRDKVLPGFEDWYGVDSKHYNPAADPLFISNLEQDILAQLKESLNDMSIKHIVLVVMESTRKDLFPVKKGGFIWNQFAKASGGNLTEDAAERLKTLTATAGFLTGDYDDGFEREEAAKKRRGGLNFNDAYTAATYTRKSMVGTLCGVWPLVADFNMEYISHIYQPCLPQILEAFNHLDAEEKKTSKWHSHYMQSVSLAYDHADVSTEQFGFQPEDIIGANYLRSASAKFGQVNLPNINYFGMAEAPLLGYVKDAFAMAKENNERVFLTHLTSTTHHPYAMPADETYVPLGNGRLDSLSHYVNTIGYDDRWLGKVLNALDEEGVADETLVIVTGDHGISLPENNKPASYYNPNVGCNHVPLVISHPKLPPVDISESVSSTDLLPTILDLLRETNSLSEPSRKAASDLLGNYEGQSLIRKLADPSPSQQQRQNHSGSPLPGTLGNWQFIVMNPGRAMLGVRDRRRQNWRLVVPVIQNVEWKFTDLELDPTDTLGVQAFDFAQLIMRVEAEHGRDAAVWAEEAAFIARWWVEENNKRWQYGVYEPKREKQV